MLKWHDPEANWSGTSYLFPSPGIVGPDDANTRDRAEWCMINIDEDDDTKEFIVNVAHGTEFENEGYYGRIPIGLLGLPAETRLESLKKVEK